MKIKVAHDEYLKKAQKLSKVESERVLSRMTGKLPRRLHKDKLTEVEALAIQLELEDEMLKEWRDRVAEIREKDQKDVAEQVEAEKPKADKSKPRD